MQTLLLADDLFPDLINGKKNITIRNGRREISTGDLRFTTVSGNEVCGQGECIVDVWKVQYKPLGAVTKQEARQDGAKDIEELVEDMKRFYPDITKETIVTVIHFN